MIPHFIPCIRPFQSFSHLRHERLDRLPIEIEDRKPRRPQRAGLLDLSQHLLGGHRRIDGRGPDAGIDWHTVADETHLAGNQVGKRVVAGI